MAYQAYRFRLYPTPQQERDLTSQLETLRQVYNGVLGYWNDFYAEEKRSPNATEVYKQIASLRNAQLKDQKDGGSGPHWLTQVSAVSMRDAALRVTKAFERFFAIASGKIKIPKSKKPRKDGRPYGYPRFKRRGGVKSIPFGNYAMGCALRGTDGKVIQPQPKPQGTKRKKKESPAGADAEKPKPKPKPRPKKKPVAVVDDIKASRRGYRLDLFGVAGRVRLIVHRDVVGKIKQACVERETDGTWYVVLVTETPDAAVTPKAGPAVGIDVGLEYFLTTSDGEQVANPKILRTRLKELARLQRSVSRKERAARSGKRKYYECRNLQKSNRKVGRLHVRIKNLRKEHQHKTALRLVRASGMICVEDLNVRGMLRNNKLSRAISDAGWSGFLTVLELKARKAGVRFVKVDAGGTSQTCPQCNGRVPKDLKVRVHNCPHCGYVAHRDVASAKVILARGLNLNPCGQLRGSA